ncbi:hypothetical protein [Bacillus haynesii]|nr:hypothetical protein [Bacillus haynesii]MEC0764117.1 hypothetical protein [Bacillus haynesii]
MFFRPRDIIERIGLIVKIHADAKEAERADMRLLRIDKAVVI